MQQNCPNLNPREQRQALEQISIAALIIALGMLVDNAVQICDQSMRLQSEGMTPKEAAIEGARQLSFPMLIATGTTVSEISLLELAPTFLSLLGERAEPPGAAKALKDLIDSRRFDSEERDR